MAQLTRRYSVERWNLTLTRWVFTENLTDDPVKLSYLITANLGLTSESAQEILEMEDLSQRLERIAVILDREIDEKSD